MPAGESRVIASLDAYLDDVRADQRDAAVVALAEGDLANVDRELRECDDTPHPDAAFVDRLEGSLLRAELSFHAGAEAVPASTAVTNRPFRSATHAPGARRRLPGWPWAREQLATAALLVLTLVGSYLAFGAIRPDQERQQAPSVPAPERGGALLVEAPLSRDAIPDPFDFKVMRFRLEPDREVVITADDWLGSPGTAITYVLAGQLTLRVEAPFRILRGDGSAAEEVAAGSDILLGSGDAIMFPSESARRYANRGLEPLELLQGNLFASRPSSAGSPPGLHNLGLDLASGGLASLPASVIPATLPGPLVLRLERLDVESPELFPPSSAQGRDGVQATLLEPAPPGAARLDGEPQTAFILTLAPALSSPAAPGLDQAAS